MIIFNMYGVPRIGFYYIMKISKELRILTAFLLICFSFFILYKYFLIKNETARDKEIKETLSKLMVQVRQHVYTFDGIKERYGMALIPHLQEYTKDPCESVTFLAYSTMIGLGLDSNNITDRQTIVCDLLRNLYDEKMKISDRQYVAKRLRGFVSADFSDKSKEILKKLFSTVLTDDLGNLSDVTTDIILLVGVSEIKSEMVSLENYIDIKSEEFNERVKAKKRWDSQGMWAALKARARMGVKEDIQRCIELVEAESNEEYKAVWLFKDLSYVRQPEVVEYLNKYLNIDNVIPSKNIDVPSTNYARQAAVALEDMIEDFPGPSRHLPFDIEYCRKWMAEQKELKIIR